MAGPDDIEPLLMNQVQYAEHRGVSKQFINKLVNTNKITLDENGLIDVVATDLLLGETAERATVDRSERGDGTSANAQLTKAKTFGAVYDAKLSQLKYERERGNILPVEGVAEAAAECGEHLVRLINGSLSARADAFVGHAKDVPMMRSFLKGIETDMLGKISALFAKLEADAVASGREHAADDAAPANEPTLFDGAAA